jgi:hypothetical protein
MLADKSASEHFMCCVCIYIYIFMAHLTKISVAEAIDRQVMCVGMDN